MALIQVSDVYVTWVTDTLEPLFSLENIAISNKAKELIALALYAQVEEDHINGQVELFAKLDEIATPGLVDYYKERHGVQEVDFNKAFHLMADLGLLLKFPFTPSV